jgi:hypothetical protein
MRRAPPSPKGVPGAAALLAVAYIELVRGVPLITTFVLPLLLPAGRSSSRRSA